MVSEFQHSPSPARHTHIRPAVAASILALCVLPALTACGPSDPEPRDGPEFSQVDSAGVLISISRVELAQAPLGWTVDSEPDLVLGRGDSESDYFHEVQGVRGTEDGGVLVVDGGSRELRFHDSEGDLVRRAGGPGEGPGEFRDPVLVPVVGTDSLLVFDKRLPRAQVLSTDGEFGRTIQHSHGMPYGARAPVGAVRYRHMLFDGTRRAGGPEAPTPDHGMLQAVNRFVWYDTVTAEQFTVDSLLVDVRYYDQPLDFTVPFFPRSSAATTAQGAFITRGKPAEILDYDVEGSLRRIFRIDGFERPVTDEMIDAFIETERARRPATFGSLSRRTWDQAFQAMGAPDTLPAFQSLQVDELGWLWAEVYATEQAGPRKWVVFDTEGRAQGSIHTPPGLEIQWIGPDAVLGVWRDEFEVEYVHRHRLTRDGGPGDGG